MPNAPVGELGLELLERRGARGGEDDRVRARLRRTERGALAGGMNDLRGEIPKREVAADDHVVVEPIGPRGEVGSDKATLSSLLAPSGALVPSGVALIVRGKRGVGECALDLVSDVERGAWAER